MSDLQLRAVSSDREVEQYKRCYEEVWRQGKPFEAGELDPSDHALRYLAVQGKEVVGSFKLHRFRTTWNDTILDCAGVASVGVVPHHRSSGVGAQMMRLSLREMWERGFSLAALYPFRGKYYRQFGYEFCGSRWQIKCPVSRLPKYAPELRARRISVEDVVSLDGCYREFIRGYNGANVRTDEQWRLRMGKGAPLIYAVGDPIEAYAWTSMDGGFWEELSIGEIAWSSPRGYRSIMSVLRGLAINRSHLIWSEPAEGPYITQNLDQGADIELHRPAMFRIINVERMGLHGVNILDPDLPENSGIHGERLITGGVGAITQAVLGEPSIDSLVSAGTITATDLTVARATFPSKPVLCTEFF
ncbi:MAG: GNAT family N-acetyltransferase [Fimbriimonadaceae bacterium]|nr:GNAT family N-acetyltransferase [Fimbriimonadaceae bacterium]